MQPIYSVIIILICIATIMVSGRLIAVHVLKDQPWRNHMKPVIDVLYPRLTTILRIEHLLSGYGASIKHIQTVSKPSMNKRRLLAWKLRRQQYIEKAPIMVFLKDHPAPRRQAD